MKKTLVHQNEFGKIYMWGTDKYGYSLQMEKPKDREIHVLKEQISAAKKFIKTLDFITEGVMYTALEKFMAMGVYGVFNIIKHQSGTVSLEPKRFVPQSVKDNYRMKKEAEATYAAESSVRYLTRA